MNKFDDMMAYLKRSLREQGQAAPVPHVGDPRAQECIYWGPRTALVNIHSGVWLDFIFLEGGLIYIIFSL